MFLLGSRQQDRVCQMKSVSDGEREREQGIGRGGAGRGARFLHFRAKEEGPDQSGLMSAASSGTAEQRCWAHVVLTGLAPRSFSSHPRALLTSPPAVSTFLLALDRATCGRASPPPRLAVLAHWQVSTFSRVCCTPLVSVKSRELQPRPRALSRVCLQLSLSLWARSGARCDWGSWGFSVVTCFQDPAPPQRNGELNALSCVPLWAAAAFAARLFSVWVTDLCGHMPVEDYYLLQMEAYMLLTGLWGDWKGIWTLWQV